MKPNRVATLDARKYKAVSQCVKNVGTVLLMSLLFLIISCDKSDDLEPIDNETPPANETPPNEESNIIYTDIEPDFTSENLDDSYNLDLNNDQNVDFKVMSFWGPEMWESELVISSVPIDRNGILSLGQGPPYTAFPLNRGVKISTTEGEFYQTQSFFNSYECIGCISWKDKLDKYLGLRFIIDGKTHYGWARLYVTSTTQWVIKDYAYNATPNMPIFAGQRE